MNQANKSSLLHDFIESQLDAKKEIYLSMEDFFDGLRNELIIPYQQTPEFCVNPQCFSQLENADKILGVRIKNDDIYLNRLIDMEGVLLYDPTRNYILKALLFGVLIGIGLSTVLYALWKYQIL